MTRLIREDPNTISVETFNIVLTFMVRYLREVMFLRGHIDQWVTIMDMNGAYMMSLPRKLLFQLGQMCQDNLMWILHKSFYVSAGFDTRLFYKAASFFLDPITK
jgi:hypothetical protein